MTRQRFLRFDCLHSLKFPSCSLPRLDTSVNFTRKHRRASPCAELSVVSDYNRLLTQYVHPKIVYIRVFLGGGSGFFFFFLHILCQNPAAFTKFNVRSCTNFCHFSMMIYIEVFFYKTSFTLRISHYFTRPSPSFFLLWN